MQKVFLVSVMVLCMSACAGNFPFKNDSGLDADSIFKFSEFPLCSDFSQTRTCLESDKPRKIAVFFDGTGNTEESRTNIAKLHNKVTLSDKPFVHALYVQGVGVGTDNRLTGGVFGDGLDDRVKLAYRFLAKRYNAERGDKIYLFGFSRGAYSARVLAGLIRTADFPDFSGLQDDEAQAALVDDIFTYYKQPKNRDSIKDIPGYRPKSTDVRIAFMGLFDTVSALSYRPKSERELDKLSDEYVDQICNIDKVFHAMSIDDNRGTTFSPMPMSLKSIASTCDEVGGLSGSALDSKIAELIDERLLEVWFSGAHSDVGGGYSDNDHLSAVPLNWMMRQISKIEAAADLLPEKPFVYEDLYAPSHIGEEALANGVIYINKNRELAYYPDQLHEKGRPLTIHSSVIARRAVIPRTCKEYDFSQQVNADLESEDRCYKSNQTPNNIRGFGKCFDKVALDEGSLRDNPLLADFTLEFKCAGDGDLIIINESGRYQ